MIDELIERSKVDLDKLPESIPTYENNDPIVAITASNKIMINPVWQFDHDDIEGKMYRRYISEHPKYNTVYVRQKVASMLELAANNLPANWKLVIIAGHRPKEVQLAVFNEFHQLLARQNPSMAKDELLDLTRRYVSDPDRKLPPHCCGSAVDVTAFDTNTNNYVDFGSQFNDPSSISAIHDTTIPKIAQKNRRILLRAMLNAGFSSLESEWWHFSYGDQNWAAFYRHDFAFYGMKEVI